MAEGATPGAPQISGTDDDPQHFNHQPPPIATVHFGRQSGATSHVDFEDPGQLQPPAQLRPDGVDQNRWRHRRHRSRDDDDDDSTDTSAASSPVLAQIVAQGSPVRRNSPPPPPLTPLSPDTPRRAHFPSEPITRTYSAPEREQSVNGPGDRSADADETVTSYDGEKDRNPAAHRGLWQDFRDWGSNLWNDLGTPHQHQDRQDLIGDVGIDLQTIRKITGKGKKGGKKMGHNRVSSLIAPSTMLARPGLGTRSESSSTIQTIPSGSSTAVGSGTATPETTRKLFGSGLNAQDLTKALRKLKVKAAKADSKEAKYIQAQANLAHRRNLVLWMVYAFMAYGAPTHRIEEYTLQLLRALDMQGRVNYTVGCTEISFINPIDPDDPFTMSAYSTIVKAQGLDIGACEVAFRLYKDVVHGDVTIEAANKCLEDLLKAPPFYKPWGIVPCYGLGSALTCVWAFGGYWTDMPISFFLGCIVGLLQIVFAAKNPLYSNVLEVTAALITSFGARAFASIGGPGQPYFCFGAIAESSICMILPGYIVLCGTLELQSKSVTAGSTRLFYAIIYSLFLGYGMAVGSQLWGAIYPGEAPNSAECPRFIDPRWKILLVPSYLVVQAVLIRARPRQVPVQVIIGSAAYTVGYFVSNYATAQVADTASALTLGVLGHLWARSRRAFAFAAVVAGIMVLVPSGLSAQGGLLSGLETPLFNNGTTSAETIYEQNIYRSFSAGAQMITVAIGLAVGIFLSALVVYPFGRKNNALFSF